MTGQLSHPPERFWAASDESKTKVEPRRVQSAQRKASFDFFAFLALFAVMFLAVSPPSQPKAEISS
jgi:hypothetical protein